MSAVLAPTADAYLAEAIADELALAKLLGFIRLEVPSATDPKPLIWGVHKDFRPEWEGAQGRAWLPRWRRSWDGAGELIARCNLSVMPGGTCVVVEQAYDGGDMFDTSFSSHPTKDDAFRYAICKAAIEYLTAERAAA